MFFFFIGMLFFLAVLLRKHQTWKAQPWPAGALPVPKVQAHRGYWVTGARENTLQAFAAAAHEGFRMFELDVRLTADGVLVVFHDADLKRFFEGDPQPLATLTYAQLKDKMDIPTLEEVLTTPKRPPFINIELKGYRVLDSSLEKATALLLRRLAVQNQVLISSFNPVTIFKLSFLLPEVPRALLATAEKEEKNAFYLRKLWLAPYVRAQALHLDHRFISPAKVAAFVSRGVPVALWTVNEKEKAQAYLQAGALSVISDVIKPEDLN